MAQEVAAWRERRAQVVDLPVRTVLPDLALQAIAHRPPASVDALSTTCGAWTAATCGRRWPSEVLAAVARGRALPAAELRLPPADDVPKELRAPVALVMAWVAQLARDERIDAALLATRGDLAAYLRGDPDVEAGPRLAGRPWWPSRSGPWWRAGRSLAFDGAGRLVLEERSGRPFRLGTPPADTTTPDSLASQRTACALSGPPGAALPNPRWRRHGAGRCGPVRLGPQVDGQGEDAVLQPGDGVTDHGVVLKVDPGLVHEALALRRPRRAAGPAGARPGPGPGTAGSWRRGRSRPRCDRP